jgi:hypothetical protein
MVSTRTIPVGGAGTERLVIEATAVASTIVPSSMAGASVADGGWVATAVAVGTTSAAPPQATNHSVINKISAAFFIPRSFANCRFTRPYTWAMGFLLMERG